MRRPPPEIDALMWAVAEHAHPEAVIEFESRHPEHRLELLKRIEMVRSLRQEARGPSFRSREIPKFEMRRSAAPASPRGVAVAAAFGFVAVCFAAFTAYQSTHLARRQQSNPTRSVINSPLSQPQVVYQGSPGNDSMTQRVNPLTPKTLGESRPEEHVVSEDKRRDLVVRDADLVLALSAVVSNTPIRLRIARGFVDQRVSLSFHDKTTREMLEAMAHDYAFTMTDEGNDRLVLAPFPDTPIQANAPRSPGGDAGASSPR